MNEVTACRAVLIEVLTVLARNLDKVVVVGGWVQTPESGCSTRKEQGADCRVFVPALRLLGCLLPRRRRILTPHSRYNGGQLSAASTRLQRGRTRLRQALRALPCGAEL